MSPSGPNIATVGTSVAGSGIAWVNPNDVGSTSSFATNTTTSSNVVCNPLNATGFNFNLPPTAIIDGIEITYNRYIAVGVTGNFFLQLLKAGSVAGNYVQDGGATNTATLLSEGGPTNLWGATWLYSDINNANFGLEIVFNETHGDFGEVFVNDVTITVYWHTAPALVNKRVLYQVFNSAGQYLGLLPNVTSPFTYSHDINTSGTQTTITCAVSVDSAGIPVTTIDTESGSQITDESGNDLYTERTPDVAGDSNTDILFKNGNKILIYEIDYWHPNGQLRFRGEINRWEAQIGTGNDQIKLLCYSDGSDMNNKVVTGGTTLDQSQTSQNTGYSLQSTSSGKENSFNFPGQSFIPANALLTAVSLLIANTSGAVDITVSVYSGIGTGLIGQVTQTVSVGSTPTEIQFIIPAVAVTVGATYFFGVTIGANQSATVYYDNSNVYANGSMYVEEYSGGGGTEAWNITPSGTVSTNSDLYFKTFYGGNSTTVSYSSVDPSNMFIDIVDRYNSGGGKMTASSATVPLTGLSTTYTFVVASVLEGIQEALALAPADWYWVGDLGSDVLTFQPASSATTHTLIKGKHIASINIISTIENIVNTLYFSGGIPSGGTQNIFAIYTNSSSVNAFGQRLDRQSDNRVTIQATADAIGNSSVGNTSPEQYQTQVVVQYPSYDITLFKPGDMINFAGFGTFVDKLSLQIVRVEYKTDQVTLTLGIQPPRQQIQVQQTLDGLVAQQTIANPPTPA